MIAIAGAAQSLVALRASHVSHASAHMMPTSARRLDWVVESVLRGDERLLALFGNSNPDAEIAAEQCAHHAE